ncbi:MAG: ferritin family protein [Bacteroidales bacterium]|nr:ferritin family protein [Bacteroidales bacterium]
MEAKSTTDILKEAILLEQRGKAFYSTVAAQTKSEAVRQVFSMMADEEEQHIAFLSRQFSHYEKHRTFTENAPHEEDPSEEVAMKVLSAEMKTQISAAGFEAAAIGAAIDFETRAVNLYAGRAESATDRNEKETYLMLAEWERGHHKWLMMIDKDLREQVWFDNNFWPF